MSNEELQKKIDEYCKNQMKCNECIFGDATCTECLGDSNATDKLKRSKALNRFKKEILGEGKPSKVKRDNILDKAIEKEVNKNGHKKSE